MRTKPGYMVDGEPEEPSDEPGKSRWDSAVGRVESYEEGDCLVIYDSENPLAWIKSDFFGIPTDVADPAEPPAGDDESGT